MDRDPTIDISDVADYFVDMTEIQEIDHMDDEMFIMYAEQMNLNNFQGILVMENVMGIAFSTFYNRYPSCKAIIENTADLDDDQFREKFSDINIATRIILCLNGEINSAFNRRLRMLKLDLIPNLEEELHFIELVSMKFKKSSIAWHYRKAVLTHFLSLYIGEKAEILKILDSENIFLEKFLKKYPRNYYGWSYKKFLYEEILLKNKLFDRLYLEFFKQKDICEKNIHDYSSFHLLEFLISELREKIDLKEELSWIKDLILKYEQMYTLERQDPSNLEVKLYEMETAKKYLKFLEMHIK